PRDEVIGRTVFEVGLWAELADRERIIGPLATQRAVHNVETRFRHKSGSLIDVQVSLERVDLGGEPCLVGLVTDVTQRKAAEQALREHQAAFAAVCQSNPEASSVPLLAGGRLGAATLHFKPLLGSTRAEVIGRTANEVGPWAEPADRERWVSL